MDLPSAVHASTDLASAVHAETESASAVHVPADWTSAIQVSAGLTTAVPTIICCPTGVLPPIQDRNTPVPNFLTRRSLPRPCIPPRLCALLRRRAVYSRLRLPPAKLCRTTVPRARAARPSARGSMARRPVAAGRARPQRPAHL